MSDAEPGARASAAEEKAGAAAEADDASADSAAAAASDGTIDTGKQKKKSTKRSNMWAGTKKKRRGAGAKKPRKPREDPNVYYCKPPEDMSADEVHKGWSVTDSTWYDSCHEEIDRNCVTLSALEQACAKVCRAARFSRLYGFCAFRRR